MNYVIITTNGELYHHGVLGQKWGVRRYQNKDGSLTAAGKLHKDRSKSKTAINQSNNHEDYNKAHDKSKKVSSMSNAELKEINKRLNMEQEYKRLSSNDINTGRDYVNKLIKAGTTVATVTSTALTIYNNYDKIKKIVNSMQSDRIIWNGLLNS